MNDQVAIAVVSEAKITCVRSQMQLLSDGPLSIGSVGFCTGGESKTLVVNNLSYDATEESLQEVFEKASAIRIPQNNQGRPKG